MIRREGEQTATENEKKFPHIVELAVPAGGFGAGLIAIFDFHDAHGVDVARGRFIRHDDRDFTRWCFPDENTAREFIALFGGAVVPATGPLTRRPEGLP